MSHCFISYTNAKTEQVAIQLATKLADKLKGEPPHIDIWIDNRSIHAGNWDEQVSEAIKSCKCVLFIVSPDSVTSNSICADEIDWALRYKKHIIPLLAYQNAEVPFRLSRRKFVDFTGDFETALSQLRNLLAWLDTPEGELQKLNDRLADAQRDLRRYPEQTTRIEKEIEELNSQIQVQQRIVTDPKAAAEQTQANIEAGLERERKPQLPLAAIQSTKFINPPPGIAPNYFQDRTVETKQILDFLKDGAQRMFTIVGRGGVGKTAMVCRLLKHLENSAVPEDVQKAFPETQPVSIDGIVYLSESGSHRVNFANIFYDLCKLLTKETAQELDAVYKNPQGSTESKMRALLEKFTGNPIVLLLDNFEPLVDDKTFEITDAELNEALLAFLNGTHTAVNIIITTRIAPKKLNLVQPGRQRPLNLDDGLESPYAENILREMDSDGRLGLKTAPNELLKQAKEKTRGFPRALEALYAILASDRYTSLEEILNTAGRYLPETVVQELVGEAFNRLDTNAQKVMQALAVYNRPVTPAAVDYLLAPHIPAMDSAPILQRLVSMHFARRFEGGKFYLHPTDREYAFSTIPEGYADDKLRTSKGVELLAYYFKILNKYPEFVKAAAKPKSKQAKEAFEELAKKENINLLQDLARSMQDLNPALLQKIQDGNNFKDEAFLAELNDALRVHLAWTRYSLTFCAADYFAAARKPRAEWKKLEDLSAQLAEFDLRCAAGDYDTAASVLLEIDFDYLLLWGHFRLMIELHERLQGKIGDKTMARASAGNLGLANDGIGKYETAIKYYQQVLELARKDRDKFQEAASLGNLGNVYYNLGNARKAIELNEQALVIAREIGDRNGEANRLGSLGSAHASLGGLLKAIEFHEQALVIAREIGDRRGEGTQITNLGNRNLDLGDIHKAVEYYTQALIIDREIGDSSGEETDLLCLGGSYSNLGEHSKSIEFYQQALTIIDEIGDHRNKAYALSSLGSAYFDLDKMELSIKNFKEAIEMSDEISLSKIQNRSRYGLAQTCLLQNDLANARGTIEAALEYDVSDNNHNVSALHGIIALRQGDDVTARGAFVRAIGQADEILSKTAEYYSALDAKGLALSGLAVVGGQLTAQPPTANSQPPTDYRQQAIEAFKQARKIAPHAGIVKSVLRLFDELAKCEGGEMLKDIRPAAEGKPTN